MPASYKKGIRVRHVVHTIAWYRIFFERSDENILGHRLQPIQNPTAKSQNQAK